jgi:hypothetical protein
MGSGSGSLGAGRRYRDRVARDSITKVLARQRALARRR